MVYAVIVIGIISLIIIGIQAHEEQKELKKKMNIWEMYSGQTC